MSLQFAPWVLPVILSAVTLGIYDITKKHAVNANSVMPVLFFSTLSGCAAIAVISAFNQGLGVVCALSAKVLALVWLKSLLVAASWVCAYYAMRSLPISIASPVRASAPFWTFLGGLLIYHEIPSPVQAAGMLLKFAGYFAFSVIGKLEGFSIRHKGMILIFAGTLLGAVSALYDKYLLNVLNIPHTPLQFHFALDLCVILGAAWATRHAVSKIRTPFVWKWSIFATGILLVTADFLYFYALSMPDIKISIFSLIRRSGCIISFTAGSLFFRDKHLKIKAAALMLILLGVVLLTVKFKGA
ncbi:MAG: DMT family transporter [Lentisphaeria bacterium]|nr:DMT family transporter [Lentisphaeria bacterium]